MRELLPGTVVLVGGGPGDPGLMTVAGIQAIREADVIVHDRLGALECLAEARGDAEIIPVGKIPRGHYTPQEEINRLLIEHAQAGKRVVRLKGGDPYLFGRGGEEHLACRDAGVPVEVIPGITSAVSVPALAGIPVTHRGATQGFIVVSGHVPPGDERSDIDWAALARTRLTIVVLMGVHNLPRIATELIAQGLPTTTPSAVIADGSTARQVVVRAPLDGIAAAAAEKGIEPPAITVIGEVADLNLIA